MTSDPGAPPLASTAGAPRVLVATGDPGLLDDLLRLAAAAGVEVEAVPDAVSARRAWSSAAGVLVGDDLAPALLLRPPSRRDGVVLVGIDQDDAGIWRRGLDVGAGHVVFLPDAETWLVGWLSDRADLRAGRRSLGVGTVVGVVGGRGGGGASTLAVALGLAAARQGASVMLVEADPLGGGLDLMLGLEHAEGLRWPDLAGSRGRVSTVVADGGRAVRRRSRRAALGTRRRPRARARGGLGGPVRRGPVPRPGRRGPAPAARRRRAGGGGSLLGRLPRRPGRGARGLGGGSGRGRRRPRGPTPRAGRPGAGPERPVRGGDRGRPRRSRWPARCVPSRTSPRPWSVATHPGPAPGDRWPGWPTGSSGRCWRPRPPDAPRDGR